MYGELWGAFRCGPADPINITVCVKLGTSRYRDDKSVVWPRLSKINCGGRVGRANDADANEETNTPARMENLGDETGGFPKFELRSIHAKMLLRQVRQGS